MRQFDSALRSRASDRPAPRMPRSHDGARDTERSCVELWLADMCASHGTELVVPTLRSRLMSTPDTVLCAKALSSSRLLSKARRKPGFTGTAPQAIVDVWLRRVWILYTCSDASPIPSGQKDRCPRRG